MMRFTPTEKRILAVLADGNTHIKSELVACLNDEQAVTSTLSVHLCYLRRKLRKISQTIVCVNTGLGGLKYQHVRLLVDVNEG